MRFWRRPPESPAAVPLPAGAGEASAAVVDKSDTDDEARDRAEVHEFTERALERTRRGLFSRLGSLFERADFDDSLWDELEEVLIGADTGLPTTTAILERVRARVRTEGVKQSAAAREILREELEAILTAPAAAPPAWAVPDAPTPLVILVVGVNGAGKTTSIAKLAHAFQRDGARVIIAAADTFRAAAIDQLRIWGERVGARVVGHQPGADPSAVVFDALSAAESSSADVVIVDTAGRLHTKSNLMDELTKMSRVIQRKYADGPHETLLVLDATSGQNGLAQARTFTSAVGVTGIILAKLDGTARGGIAFAIAHDLAIPVRFIGTGERMEDLAPFDPAEFVHALLA